MPVLTLAVVVKWCFLGLHGEAVLWLCGEVVAVTPAVLWWDGRLVMGCGGCRNGSGHVVT